MFGADLDEDVDASNQFPFERTTLDDFDDKNKEQDGTQITSEMTMKAWAAIVSRTGGIAKEGCKTYFSITVTSFFVLGDVYFSSFRDTAQLLSACRTVCK